MSVRLRAMTQDDIEQGYAITQRLHWPHRHEDWQQALALGEGVVAEEQGKFVGCAVGWRWGERAATIGLVMVNPDCHGRGIGKQLMLAVLEKFPDAVIRLHATEMGKGLYEKLGFVVTGSIQQLQTKSLVAEPVVRIPTDLTLRNVQPQDAVRLTELDHQAHGMWRPQLMHTLIADHQTLLLQDAQQQVQGFASLRRFGHGWAIGPVIARNIEVAQALIAALMQGLRGEFVRIDTDSAQQLVPWLAGLGLAQVDAPTTMYRGTPWSPQAGDMQTFALMTQAMA